MSALLVRSNRGVAGALSHHAIAVLRCAERAGSVGAPPNELIAAQVAVDPDASRAHLRMTLSNLKQRGLLLYSGAWRTPGANWVLTEQGRQALDRATNGPPLRHTDRLVHAMLQTLIEAEGDGVPMPELVDVQMALQPDRSRETAKTLIHDLRRRQRWICRVRKHETTFEYGVTGLGRLAFAELDKQMQAHSPQEPASADHTPPNTQPITYAGRTVHVPTVRWVFDLAAAHAAHSNHHQTSAE